MIIRRIKLHPFAGIANKEILFGETLNVVLGVNEAGKSTIFNAIYHALFTNSKLKKLDYENIIEKFIPIGGNTARVELEFYIIGVKYTLRKNWHKSSPLSELVLPDGAVLTGDDSVNEKLNGIRPASKAAFTSVLMAYQSRLSATIEELKSSGAVTDINDILQSAVFNTGGVSIDAFKESLFNDRKDYFSRWDIEKQCPENGRGIENPWVKDVGSILKYYYALEEFKAELSNAETFEDKYDEVNKRIEFVMKEINEKEKYVTDNGKVVEDARMRRLLKAELMGIESKIIEMTKANEDLPVIRARINNAPEEMKKLKKRESKLAEEQKTAQIQDDNKELLNSFRKLSELKSLVHAAKSELASVPVVTKENIDTIRKYKAGVDTLKASINAGKLNVDVTAKKNITVKYISGTEDAAEKKLSSAETLNIPGRGRVFLETPDFTIDIKSGDEDFTALQERLDNGTKMLSGLLLKLNVEDEEKVLKAFEKYDNACRKNIHAEENYNDELKGASFEEIEKKATELIKDNTPGVKTRSIGDILGELIQIRNEIGEKEKILEEDKSALKSYEEKYKTSEELMLVLSEEITSRKKKQEQISNLAPLPAITGDEDSFIRDYELAKSMLEKAKNEKNSLEVEKAKLEGTMPERSVEEINYDYKTAEHAFYNNLRKGNAILRLINVTEDVESQSGGNIFEELGFDIRRLVSDIISDRYTDVKMQDSVPLALVKADGTIVPGALLSAGTQDVLGLALRLAVAAYFLKDEKGFIAMDDPLVDLDPERQRRAAEIIKSFAENKQTIIFTCHPSTSTLLSGNLIEI